MSEPKKFMQNSRSTIRVINGEAVLDDGINNMVLYSLFTSSWNLNKFVDLPLGSTFEKECEKPITVTQLLYIETAALGALKWMVTNKIISSVKVKAEIDIKTGGLKVAIQIEMPVQGTRQYNLSRYTGNWSVEV